MKGWIKLHRRLRKSRIWQCTNDAQKVFAINVLLIARHEKGVQHCKRCATEISVPPGGLVCSYSDLSKEFSINRPHARRHIKRLIELDFLSYTTHHCHSMLVIKNYDKYQELKKLSHSGTHLAHTVAHTADISTVDSSLYIQEVKNNIVANQGKSDKKNSIAKGIALRWMEHLPYYQSKQDDKFKHLDSWVKQLELLHRDGKSWSDITKLIGLIIKDRGGPGKWNGWYRNCQSPRKLRQKTRDNPEWIYFDYIWDKLVTEDKSVKPLKVANPDE